MLEFTQHHFYIQKWCWVMKHIKKIIKKDFEFLFFLLILTIIVYATSWGGKFISDDIAGIQNKPTLGNFLQQAKTLSVVNIFYSLIYNIFGPKPFWYHILNTLFHTATVVVVYVLTTLLSQKKWLSRFTALLFALHPIETEGVSWISGFPYAAYTFFLLLALLFFILVEKKNVGEKYIWASALFYALALKTTEKAIIFPAILFAYILIFSKISWKKIKLTLPVIGVGILYGITLFGQFTQRVTDVAPSYSGGPALFNPLVQIPIAIYSYIKLLVFPLNLTLYHEFTAFPQWEYYLAIFVTLIVLSGAVIFWRRLPLAGFGLLLFFISLLPTLLPINVGWVVAERYVHLGSVGMFVALSSIVMMPFMASKNRNSSIYGVINHTTTIAVLALILSLLTVKRNLEWRSQDTLWPATVRESPYSAYAHNNMGDYYGRHGDIENSIREFEIARQLRPKYADATHNLANAYLKINEATKAAELYKEALEYNPTLYQSHQQLGKIRLSLKDLQSSALKPAEYYFLQSAKLNPDPLVDYLYLYLVYNNAGNQEKAQEAILSARKLAGTNPQRLQLIQQIISDIE